MDPLIEEKTVWISEHGIDGSWLCWKFSQNHLGFPSELEEPWGFATIWYCLLKIEDCGVWLWQAGDVVYINMGQIWEVYV